MQLWYVCKENQLSGPFKTHEIVESIEAHEITANDWLRRSEEIDWTLAAKHQDFQHLFTSFETEKLPFEENWKEKWVLLRHREGTYSQSGPFTTTEILSQVYKGETEYSDFVWQQGMSDWKRIGSLDPFIPKQESPTSESNENQNAEKVEDILANIMTNVNSVNTYYQQELPLTEEIESFPLQTKKAIKSQNQFPTYYKPVVNKKKRWWFFSFFCFILSLLIAIWGKNSLSLYL